MEYYLLDLERTLKHGTPTFWKSNKRGYTRLIDEAGLYDYDAAKLIEKEDLDNRTILVSKYTVKRILH